MKARRGEGEGSVDLARAEFPDSLKGGEGPTETFQIEVRSSFPSGTLPVWNPPRPPAPAPGTSWECWALLGKVVGPEGVSGNGAGAFFPWILALWTGQRMVAGRGKGQREGGSQR